MAVKHAVRVQLEVMQASVEGVRAPSAQLAGGQDLGLARQRASVFATRDLMQTTLAHVWIVQKACPASWAALWQILI